MADLAGNALLAFDEYCEFVGVDQTESELSEERFNRFCNIASDRVERFCNRKFITAANVTEIHSGDGEKDLYVKNRPLTATPTVKWWTGIGWQETLGTFTYDSESGRIWFTDGGTFWKGKDNWQITYSYGYAIGSIPDELKAACAILVQRMVKKADGKEGVSSETYGENTTSYSLAKMPEDVAEMLQRHRRLING